MTPAQRRIRQWRQNPLIFVQDNFGVEPDKWQVKALLSQASPTDRPRRRLIMKACTGPGKSAVLAWLAWWRLSCFAGPGEYPKGAIVSGEGYQNLIDNSWSEVSKWQNRSEFLRTAFTWTKSQVYATERPEGWFLSARSYPKDANADSIGRSLSGLHSNYPFILIDESGGAPPVVGQKAEQIFTGGVIDGFIGQAGNPVSTTGLLYQSCMNPNPGDTIITISADPNDPDRTPRVDPEHAKAMIEKYGIDNPWVASTILGKFPSSAINTLLSLEDVTASMKREYHPTDFEGSQKRLGVDCARFGSDATAIAPRQGLVAFKPVMMRGARSNEIAARVALAKSRWHSEVEFVDGSGGYGSGVVDSLIQAGYSPVEVQFAGKPQDNRFLNARAEMLWRCAEWVKRGGKLPNDQSLIKQLIAPTYTFSNGKFQIEPKETIKKRLGYSIDYFDALGLTFFHPETPAGIMLPANLAHLAEAQAFSSEWDPASD